MTADIEEKKREASRLKKLYHPIFYASVMILGVLVGKRWGSTWPLVPTGEGYLLATAITVMAMAMMKDRFFQTIAVRTLEDIRDETEIRLSELKNWVTDRLNPAIISLDGRDKVLLQAASIIHTASKEDSPGFRYVVYFGSGELYREPAPTEDRSSPLNDYRSAIAQLGNKRVRVMRYISLLEPTDRRLRWPQRRDEYKSWIAKQALLLEQNAEYKLFDCPRAPSWGGSRSSIVTARALLDVVGNGESGVLIRGDQVAQDTLTTSTALLESARVIPFAYDPQSLRVYLKSLDPVPETAGA